MFYNNSKYPQEFLKKISSSIIILLFWIDSKFSSIIHYILCVFSTADQLQVSSSKCCLRHTDAAGGVSCSVCISITSSQYWWCLQCCAVPDTLIYCLHCLWSPELTNCKTHCGFLTRRMCPLLYIKVMCYCNLLQERFICLNWCHTHIHPE